MKALTEVHFQWSTTNERWATQAQLSAEPLVSRSVDFVKFVDIYMKCSSVTDIISQYICQLVACYFTLISFVWSSYLFSRVATKSNSAYNMMNVVRASTFSFPPNILRCLVVRGGSLLILRIVGQRSRSQLLKIEQKFDKNEMLGLNETWYTHAW